MQGFEEHGQGDNGRGKRLAIAGAVVLVALVLVYGLWALLSRPEKAERSAPDSAATSAPAAPTEPGAPSAEPEAPSEPTPARPRPKREKAAPAPAEHDLHAPPALVLRVESDVPGASVFVDRRYLGTTPLETSDVTPGAHQLNVSAEGQEGIVRTIDVAESGPTEVSVRFREVRLNLSIPVVHKHAMGKCEGRLVATNAGLRYETSNKGDAFTLPFADVAMFEIEYLEKNLKVKKQGGRTWNFTEPSGSADALFVFHRDVTKAREKLRAGSGG